MNASAMHSWHRWRSAIAWPLVAIVMLLLVNAAFDWTRTGTFAGAFQRGGFLSIVMIDGRPTGAIMDTLSRGATVALLAIGMALVIAGRGIDLSIGTVMAITGVTAAAVVDRGAPGWLAIPAALAAALVCGAWNGFLVTIGRLQPFVATLILMVAGRGIAQALADGQILTFRDPVIEFLSGGRVPWLPVPVPLLVAMLAALVTFIATRRTAAGLLLEAVGSNPGAARLAGIRERLLVFVTYVASALCAGLAGLIECARVRSADPSRLGLSLELAGIFAVVAGGASLAGGRFVLGGAIAGAYLLQTMTTTMYARDVSSDVAPLPIACVILAVCLLGSPRFRSDLRAIVKRGKQ
ncbi:MAG: ABC transporter permease [Phycisphaerae bacterium]|nr:ABC transporter permease [Phycisphaerae bacterium]